MEIPTQEEVGPSERETAYKNWRDPRLPKVEGMDPDSLLVSSFLRRSEPQSSEWRSADRLTTFVSEPISAGIDPVRAFRWRTLGLKSGNRLRRDGSDMVCSLMQLPIVGGIWSVNWFHSASLRETNMRSARRVRGNSNSSESLTRFPIDEGIGPVRLLFERDLTKNMNMSFGGRRWQEGNEQLLQVGGVSDFWRNRSAKVTVGDVPKEMTGIEQIGSARGAEQRSESDEVSDCGWNGALDIAVQRSMGS